MVDWKDLLFKGVGAGAKGALVGILKKYLPIPITVEDDWLAIALGYLMMQYGGRFHEILPKIGEGVMISAIGGLAEGYINQFVGKISPTTRVAPRVPSRYQLALRYAGRI